MATGGLSFENYGFESATFLAGAGIKALVTAHNRDFVVGMPVEITGSDTVDLGTDGDTIFGLIDVYENDGHVGVQFRGFREDVPTADTTPTPGAIVALDGAGKVKDSATTAKLRNPVFINVDATNKTATVFLG